MMSAAGALARTFIVLCAAATLAAGAASAGQLRLPDKPSRTAAEKKIDSQLLIEIDRHASPRTAGTPAPKTTVRIDKMDRALVELRVEVTPALLASLRSGGATLVSSSAEYRSIVGWIALSKLKDLAARDDVQAIMPAPEAALNR